MTPEKRAEVMRVAVRSIQAATAWASFDVQAAAALQAAVWDPEVDAILARFEALGHRRPARQLAGVLRHRARHKKARPAG